MLNLRHITKNFNEKIILENISLTVNSGEVIALIGENGAGKTTLLKILLGLIEPDDGTIALHNEIVGYVTQEPESQNTVVRESFANVEEWRIDYALGLVMLEGVKIRKIQHLSGGQKTRLALAQVLAKDPGPTVLLLDEPTNNLDSSGLAWLRIFIKNFNGVVLLVTHDRSFINEVATSVVELQKGSLKHYGGDYDFYKQQKEVEYQSHLKEYERSIEERRQLERALREKQERATKGLRNQKMRDNDKAQFDWHQNNVQRSFSGQTKAMQSRINQLSDVEKPEKAKNYLVKINHSFMHDKKLITVKNLAKSIHNKNIFRGLSFEVRSGERWHIQGLNGAGKSTLLNILADRTGFDSGELKKAEDLSIGYFSQDIHDISSTQTASEVLKSTGAHATEVYRQAMSLGLRDSDLRKRPQQLSRGQQAKLCFTKLLLSKHNLIILDEPTNHLDITTRERLEAALNNYHGALIVASHDRYFIASIGINSTLDVSRKEINHET